MAFDLPVWSVTETAATVYQKERDQFHILLTEPAIREQSRGNWLDNDDVLTLSAEYPPRLLWIEVSPYRMTMTMQGNGRFSYRHFWEQGVYGLNRYWLQRGAGDRSEQIKLRNFTRSLSLEGSPLPEHLRLEYELWSGNLRLGHYVLNLEIHH
ncbi:MAG: hypothetical protein VKL39_06700 [Leptolyngbyaceae bacterium]|nr:hypothetical protein [Leptolyngbyaceae bacterium]